MIGGMADVDFSLLDVPRSVPVDDPEAYLRAAIAWHFGEETGCAFWLRAAKTLDFNPLTDVHTFADLRLFPNLLSELRTEPVEDLIPRGYGSPSPVPQIFESGGTTGAPKRTIQLPDWIEQTVEWQTEDFATGGFLGGRGFLCMMPSGPHGVGYFSRLVSERLGSVFHTIDLDPRWVKKIAARNAAGEVTAYVDHLVEQAVHETLTYYGFPDIHWQKIRTNNPLERIMKEIRRRTRVVGAFPDGQSCLNLAAARLRHIAGTTWSAKCYMNMRPLYQQQLSETEAVA